MDSLHRTEQSQCPEHLGHCVANHHLHPHRIGAERVESYCQRRFQRGPHGFYQRLCAGYRRFLWPAVVGRHFCGFHQCQPDAQQLCELHRPHRRRQYAGGERRRNAEPKRMVPDGDGIPRHQLCIQPLGRNGGGLLAGHFAVFHQRQFAGQFFFTADGYLPMDAAFPTLEFRRRFFCHHLYCEPKYPDQRQRLRLGRHRFRAGVRRNHAGHRHRHRCGRHLDAAPGFVPSVAGLPAQQSFVAYGYSRRRMDHQRLARHVFQSRIVRPRHVQRVLHRRHGALHRNRDLAHCGKHVALGRLADARPYVRRYAGSSAEQSPAARRIARRLLDDQRVAGICIQSKCLGAGVSHGYLRNRNAALHQFSGANHSSAGPTHRRLDAAATVVHQLRRLPAEHPAPSGNNAGRHLAHRGQQRSGVQPRSAGSGAVFGDVSGGNLSM